MVRWLSDVQSASKHVLFLRSTALKMSVIGCVFLLLVLEFKMFTLATVFQFYILSSCFSFNCRCFCASSWMFLYVLI